VLISETYKQTNMKKSVIASLLSLLIVGGAVSSYGQGFIQFQNNNFGTLDAPVKFGVTANSGGRAGTAGVTVGSDFTADLLYSLDGGANYILLSQAAANDPSYPTSFGIPGATDGDSANFAGYFFGGTATIPGYTSGPVSFIVEAWQGGTTYLGATHWSGRSAPFTLASITPAGSPALPSDLIGLTTFNVLPVPEPSILALSGIGAAALMLVRRKK